MRVLGVELDASGSAALWICSVRSKVAKTLHPFQRISQKAGGACSRMARSLAWSVLQPRLIYKAQFQQLTRREWDLLESVNREAMQIIAGRPRLTPIPTLQAEAQLNTPDELVQTAEECTLLKNSNRSRCCSIGPLLWFKVIYYISQKSPDILPWSRSQSTDNWPLTRIRRFHNQALQPNPLPSELDGTTDALQVYVDARMTQNLLHTSLVCPTQAEMQETWSYLTAVPFPSILAELVAVREGLFLLKPRLHVNPSSCRSSRTASVESVYR